MTHLDKEDRKDRIITISLLIFLIVGGLLTSIFGGPDKDIRIMGGGLAFFCFCVLLDQLFGKNTDDGLH